MSVRIKIGLAEDNVDFCRLIKEFLESSGEIEVIGVSHDGLQALDMIYNNPMDLLLLDMIMPNLDGIGVLEQIKSYDNRPKIIIFSAFGHEDMTKKAVELGADYFVVKPFDLEILVQRIKEVVNKNSLTSSTFTIKKMEKQDLEMERAVIEILQKFRIPSHFKGYTYLKKAILMCISDPTMVNDVTKKLYPLIAKDYSSTKHRVERAMRFAIETACNRSEVDYLHEIMGHVIDEKKGKPTNTSFIAKIADKIRFEDKKLS